MRDADDDSEMGSPRASPSLDSADLLGRYRASLSNSAAARVAERVSSEPGFAALAARHLADLTSACESCAFDSDSSFDSSARDFLLLPARRDLDLRDMSLFVLGSRAAELFEAWRLPVAERDNARERRDLLLARLGQRG